MIPSPACRYFITSRIYFLRLNNLKNCIISLMKTQKTILKLFYKSSGWLLKLSFWTLPIALFFSISSFLFIDNLLSSYERYLINSYLGVQGRISIETKNENLINGLTKFSVQKNFLFSNKKQYKVNVVLKNDTNQISKYAKFIILDKQYLKQKFHQTTIDDNTIFVNKILYNSMGSLDINKFDKIYFDDKDKIFNITDIINIDTGFLGSEPIVFISSSFATKLFGTIEQKNRTLEFLEVDNNKIQTIKSKTKELSKQYKVLEYKILDLLQDTKTTKEFFDKVTMIQVGISILLFILSLGVIILSISVSIEFKKNSLKVLQLIGMSKKDLSFTISGTIFLMILTILALSVGSIGLFQSLFLSISNFHSSFFIALDMMNILYIVVLAFVLFIFTYLSTKIIFQRN